MKKYLIAASVIIFTVAIGILALTITRRGWLTSRSQIKTTTYSYLPLIMLQLASSNQETKINLPNMALQTSDLSNDFVITGASEGEPFSPGTSGTIQSYTIVLRNRESPFDSAYRPDPTFRLYMNWLVEFEDEAMAGQYFQWKRDSILHSNSRDDIVTTPPIGNECIALYQGFPVADERERFALGTTLRA